jgi:hypothetical protein
VSNLRYGIVSENSNWDALWTPPPLPGGERSHLDRPSCRLKGLTAARRRCCAGRACRRLGRRVAAGLNLHSSRPILRAWPRNSKPAQLISWSVYQVANNSYGWAPLRRPTGSLRWRGLLPSSRWRPRAASDTAMPPARAKSPATISSVDPSCGALGRNGAGPHEQQLATAASRLISSYRLPIRRKYSLRYEDGAERCRSIPC